jgi:hypothetical protein
MRIFVLIIPQMIRIRFSEWKKVVLVSRRPGGVKMLKVNYGHEYNDVSFCSYDVPVTGKREFRLMHGRASALTGSCDYIQVC